MKKAIVVLSGGQDSVTCLGYAIKKYKHVEAVSFKYNQRHENEVDVAGEICKKLGIKQTIINLPFFKDISDSALLDNSDLNSNHIKKNHLPASFVPNRNAMFLMIAHSLAQKKDIDHIVTGVCETDYSGYPDCRQDFISSIEESLNIGSDSNIKIITPLMYLSKAEVWKLSKDIGIINIIKNDTLTCYEGDLKMNEWGKGCGKCKACVLRKRGYQEFKRTNNV